MSVQICLVSDGCTSIFQVMFFVHAFSVMHAFVEHK